MPERLDELVRVRTRLRLAELFGDTEARRVLSVIAVALGDVEAEPMPRDAAADVSAAPEREKVNR